MPRPVTLVLVAVLLALLLGTFAYLLRRLRVTEVVASQLKAEMRAREIIEEAGEPDSEESRPKLVLIKGWRGLVAIPAIMLWKQIRTKPVAAATVGTAAASLAAVIIFAPDPMTDEAPFELPTTVSEPNWWVPPLRSSPEFSEIEVESITPPEDQSADQPEDEPVAPPITATTGDPARGSVPPAPDSAGLSSVPPSDSAESVPEPPADSESPQPPEDNTEPPPADPPGPPERDCTVSAEAATRAIDLDLCVEIDPPGRQ